MGSARVLLMVVLSVSSWGCGSAADSCNCADGETCIDGICVGDGDPPPNAAEVDCPLPDVPPSSLFDTCFAQIQAGTLAPNLRLYEPRYPFFGHGAVTRRWIYLPPGSSIDADDVDGWRYPVGTIVWQEMAVGDRIETRMLEKTESGVGRDAWRASSYLWLADQSDARRTVDGSGPGDDSYSIDEVGGYPAPAPNECMACHQSAVDALLGFTALQLSDGERQGNLSVWDGYLDTEQPPVEVVGNQRDQTVLGYLHANCGVCHNPRGTVGGLGLDLSYPVRTSTDLESTPVFQTAVYQGGYLTPGNRNLSSIWSLFDGRSMPPDEVSATLDDGFRAELSAWINELEARTAIEQTSLPITIDAATNQGRELLGYSVTASDGVEGEVFARTGASGVRSRLLVPIDTTKTYRVTGKFRSDGAVDSRIYFGLSPYDGARSFISAYQGNRKGTPGTLVPGSTTVDSLSLAAPVTGWNTTAQQGNKRAIGFYYDGDTGKLPDFVLTDSTNGAYTDATGATIALNTPLPTEVLAALTADTVVYNHYAGGTYLYTAASNQTPSSAWTEYTGTITGEAFAGGNTAFRPETVYVRFLILANYQQGDDATLYFTDLTLAEE